MVFDGEDPLVLEVILQRGVVELLEDRVELEGHDADEHILCFLAEARPRTTVYRKLELGNESELALGNEEERGGAGRKKTAATALKRRAQGKRVKGPSAN